MEAFSNYFAVLICDKGLMLFVAQSLLKAALVRTLVGSCRNPRRYLLRRGLVKICWIFDFLVEVGRTLLFVRQACVVLLRYIRSLRIKPTASSRIERAGTGTLRIFTNLACVVFPVRLLDTSFSI